MVIYLSGKMKVTIDSRNIFLDFLIYGYYDMSNSRQHLTMIRQSSRFHGRNESNDLIPEWFLRRVQGGLADNYNIRDHILRQL